MIGDFAVGKTSLTRRFVESTFSDKYLTTVGVKVDTKVVDCDAGSVKLVVWDIAGSGDMDSVKQVYLRGAQGYLLVVDGTRNQTLKTALDLKGEIYKSMGLLPHVCLLNKVDLEGDWSLDQARVAELGKDATGVFRTSAKTGVNVEAAFSTLAAALRR